MSDNYETKKSEVETIKSNNKLYVYINEETAELIVSDIYCNREGNIISHRGDRPPPNWLWDCTYLGEL